MRAFLQAMIDRRRALAALWRVLGYAADAERCSEDADWLEAMGLMCFPTGAAEDVR